MAGCDPVLNYARLKIMISAKFRKSAATVAMLLGSVVGVGIFSLPYVYQQTIPNAVFFLLLTAALILIEYFLFIDLVTEPGMGFHQLPGIIEKLFGRSAKTISGIVLLLGRIGILFLYTLVISDFSSQLINNIFSIEVPTTIITVGVVLLCSLLIRKKLSVISKVQSGLTYTKILLITIISAVGLFLIAKINPDPFSKLNLTFAPANSSLVENLRLLGTIYGVSFAALSGVAAVPVLKEMLPDRNALYRVVIIATAIAVLLYMLFSVFVILGSSAVTPDSLAGLGSAWWVNLLLIAGLLCVVTAYIGIGAGTFIIFNQEYKLDPVLSWGLTLFPPLALFLAGLRDFTSAVSVIGGVTGASEGIMIIASYWKAKLAKKAGATLKIALLILVGTVLVVGSILAI